MSQLLDAAAVEQWKLGNFRQLLHNDGSGFVFAYLKEDADKMLSDLVAELERERRISLAMAESLGETVEILGGDEHDLAPDEARRVVKQRDRMRDTLKMVVYAPTQGEQSAQVKSWASQALTVCDPEPELADLIGGEVEQPKATLSQNLNATYDAGYAHGLKDGEAKSYPFKMGVGTGDGNLFVYGDHDSIKAAQAIVLECEQLRAKWREASEQQPIGSFTGKFYGDVNGRSFFEVKCFDALPTAGSNVYSVPVPAMPIGFNQSLFAELQCIANTVEIADGESIDRQNALCHAANVIRSHANELLKDGLLVAPPAMPIPTQEPEKLYVAPEATGSGDGSSPENCIAFSEIQEPAVAVPDDEPKNPGAAYLQSFLNDDRFDQAVNSMPDSLIEKFYDRIVSVKANCDDWKTVAENLEEDIAKLRSQRITEQDAREILSGQLIYDTKQGKRSTFNAYLKSDEGRALLNKLSANAVAEVRQEPVGIIGVTDCLHDVLYKLPIGTKLYTDPVPAQAAAITQQPKLTVWYGSMPESNGKTNWTAILHRSGDSFPHDGITIDRSEYPERVKYEADRVRYLIGDLEEAPDILAYDDQLHSGYVEPTPVVAVPDEIPVHVLDAVSEALGDCYDCTRTWSAWAHGTMSQRDFVQVAESSERVEEIARAAITAYVGSQQGVLAHQSIELAYREGWEAGWSERHTSLNNDSRVTPWQIPKAALDSDWEASDAKKHCDPEVAAPVADSDNVWERAVIEAAEAVVRANQSNTGAEPSCSLLARQIDDLRDVLNDNCLGYKPSPAVTVPEICAYMLIDDRRAGKSSPTYIAPSEAEPYKLMLDKGFRMFPVGVIGDEIIPSAPKPDRTGMYFYKVDSCTATDPSHADCICWHKIGTGPLPNVQHDAGGAS